MSRSRIQQLVESGHITIEGAPVTAKQKTRAGQQVHITEPAPVPLELQPWAIALDILYEDAQVLVVNKPAGMTVHPAAGHQQDTLVNALLHHCGDSLSGIGGVERPGIVHRLDKETSGLMMVAKTDLAHQHLSQQLQNRSLSRTYLAYVWGTPRQKQGSMSGNIGRHPQHRQKMALLPAPQGKEALTHYQVQDIYLQGRICCLRLKLQTGRTHQIRVHCSHYGYPLLGDDTYGNKQSRHLQQCPANVQVVVSRLQGQALHATALEFIHPTTGEKMAFTCPLPPALQQLAEALDVHRHC